LHSSANTVDQKPHSLIVGGIQPQRALENLLGFLEPAQAPKAQPKSIHAAEKWPVASLQERVLMEPQQLFRLVGVGLNNFFEPEDLSAQPGCSSDVGILSLYNMTSDYHSNI
jgi:hypothetical protein